jgi:hypothetical protein
MPAPTKQRDLIRRLVAEHGRNKDRVCTEYAAAERSGQVQRKSNPKGLSPEQYAEALWYDGERKGWF